ncbi:hypothetical protein RN001_002478 [Aquatica leii]|uniref:DUF4806 domain-containing protein n=1 Tax=Aquatica leii TaxID=1421715 RepID=A0AAN7Q8P0_9COLE|nr:hypothetical protein RN001_002478 [Aquatica leii]
MSCKKIKIVGSRQLYRKIAKEKNQILSKSVTESFDFNSNISNNGDASCSSNSVTGASFETNVTRDIKHCSQKFRTVPTFNLNDCKVHTTSDVHTATCESADKTVTTVLRHWATTSRVPHNAVTSLLHGLSPYHPELPLDCRTLLKVEKNIVVKKLNSGEYCHLGLFYQLKNFLTNSNIQLWPILGIVVNYKSDPFAIGIFCGTSKPLPLESYLKDFLDELEDILTTGIYIEHKRYLVKIHSFVFDAPARSFLKRIKSHSGYSACERCTIHGEYIQGRVIFKSINAPKRTNKTFLEQIDEDHHLGTSPLSKLPIGLVTDFPIDYMHNVCLGVTRKLLDALMNGPLSVRLPNRKVVLISNHLESLKPYIPIDFNRKPRSLSDLSRWKATEFRTFLLYIGPLVLKDMVDIAVYENFLLLHCSITILLSNSHITHIGTSFAGKLLKTFVEHCESLYGEHFQIYNIHNLCHLNEDAERFGSLNCISSFPFENYLGQLKRLVRSTINPLQEICNRLSEIEKFSTHSEIECSQPKYLLEYNYGPLLLNSRTMYKQYKQIITNGRLFSVYSYSECDCYCKHVSGFVIQIRNILKDYANNIFIVGNLFRKRSSFYNYPINSSELGILLISKLSNDLQIWPLSEVVAKCICMPSILGKEKPNMWLSVPILHTV